MKNSVIYIVGATVLVGGAYLFLKNKKAKDLAKLNEIGGATTGGATTGGTTSGGTTLGDGVISNDAYPNLANATVLVGQRGFLQGQLNQDWADSIIFNIRKKPLKGQIAELDVKLAKLGYKVDSTGSLVKI